MPNWRATASPPYFFVDGKSYRYATELPVSRLCRRTPVAFHHTAEIARIADPIFNHTRRPNFYGCELPGERQYRLVTNNLGFNEASVAHPPG
jgi:hypothetical protein